MREGGNGVGLPMSQTFACYPPRGGRHVSRQSRTTSQPLELERAKVFEIPISFLFGRWPDFFKEQIRFPFPTLIFEQRLFRSLSILHRIKLEKVGKLRSATT